MEQTGELIANWISFEDFWPKLIGGALGTSAAAATSLAFAMIRGRIEIELSGITLLLAISTSFLVILFPVRHPNIGIILVLIGALIIHWTFVFHVFAKKHGGQITRGRFGLIIGRNWVKFIDYFYLIGSTIGIIRIAVGNIESDETYPVFNNIGILILSIALSLRITKTSIEIFGWAESRELKSVPINIKYPWS